MKKFFTWKKEKNKRLEDNRGFSFEEVVKILQDESNIIDIIPSPNQKLYPNQEAYIIRFK